jgi:(R)-2-hydroxyacyl-CoA dehydratese activating ATPase
MTYKNGKGIYAGVDVGSLTSKSVILHDGQVLGYALSRTGLGSEESGLNVFNKALENAGVKKEDIKYVVATGYGRISATYANKTVTEISCHAKGAHHLQSGVRTILDMGGQDCKAIRINENGDVIDFAMNDKCAAGTGRFLEVMSTAFNVKLEDLGALSLKSTGLVPMSSTCTVFAESETVSLLARGEKPENIIAGIHHAIANRIAGLFSRIGIESDVYFSGGVAKNSGMKAAIEEVLRIKISTTSFDPQLTGALGAAVIAGFFANKESA